MALSDGQRRQVLRLGNPDSNFNKADRFAIAGLIQTISPNLTEAQRRQIARVNGIADASIDLDDRYAIAGLIRTVNTSTTIIEVFSVEWSLDPTWVASFLPQTNDGLIASSLNQFSVDFLGGFAARDAWPKLINFSADSMGVNLLVSGVRVHFAYGAMRMNFSADGVRVHLSADSARIKWMGE